MRRGRVFLAGKVLLAGSLVLAALGACGPGRAAGVDGDLVDDWPAFAAATTPTPDTGVCYKTGFTETWTGDFESQSIDCAQQHWTETSYVGKFTGAAASGTVPPLSDSADLVDAFATCAAKTQDYLGGDWQTGYVELGVTVPGSAAWRGGARWYRCEVSGLDKNDDGEDAQLTGSAKGALAPGGPLLRTCSLVQASGTSITSAKAIDCAQPHNAEFAGLYTISADTFPSGSAFRDKVVPACQAVFTRFLGIAPSKSHWFGYYWEGITQSEWDRGVRTGQCSVLGFAGSSPNSVRFTGSVKGTGDRKPTGWK